jgi:hypothetical protein
LKTVLAGSSTSVNVAEITVVLEPILSTGETLTAVTLSTKVGGSLIGVTVKVAASSEILPHSHSN